MAVATSIIYLSKYDALDLFGCDYWDPIRVIRYWKHQFNDERITEKDADALLAEIKLLLLVPKIYLKYASADVRQAIMLFCGRCLEDIYKDDQSVLPLTHLKFLINLIYRHRHIKDYRKLKACFLETENVDKITFGLFKNRVLPCYQKPLF